MKIVCIVALHGREKLARVTIKRLQKRQAYPIEVVVVGDSECEKKTAEHCGAHYVQTTNFPLSFKWQTGIYYARSLSPDYVLIMGSDDWISDNWVKAATHALQTKNLDLIGKSEWYLARLKPDGAVDLIHQQFTDGRKSRPIGAGRLFSRRILDKLDWKLWTEPANRGLDLQSFRNFEKVGGKFTMFKGPDSPKVLLLRYDWDCVNSWDKLVNLPEISSSVVKESTYQWFTKYFSGANTDILEIIS